MVINKSAGEFKGQIEYRYSLSRTKLMMLENDCIDEEQMYKVDSFSTLTELLEKVCESALNAIRQEFDAEKAWVSRITFHSKSEDGETHARISLEENNKHYGTVTTRIDNQDIENRVMLNMQKIKQIVDNTLDQYPVKY